MTKFCHVSVYTIVINIYKKVQFSYSGVKIQCVFNSRKHVKRGVITVMISALAKLLKQARQNSLFSSTLVKNLLIYFLAFYEYERFTESWEKVITQNRDVSLWLFSLFISLFFPAKRG